MSLQEKSPTTGDMYRCEKCSLELHVTKGCDCESPCVELKCCGQDMKNVTALPVQNP